MEWLLTLIPVGLVVLVCGGLHMLMMRGMHSGHDTASGHGGHLPVADSDDSGRELERSAKPRVQRTQQLDTASGDRIAQLEKQVEALEQEIEAMLGDPPKTVNGSNLRRVAALHPENGAWRNDSEGDVAG